MNSYKDKANEAYIDIDLFVFPQIGNAFHELLLFENIY
jgi:hypothetical protein